jgi:hypothetical protein
MTVQCLGSLSHLHCLQSIEWDGKVFMNCDQAQWWGLRSLSRYYLPLGRRDRVTLFRTAVDLTKTPAGYIMYRALLTHQSRLVFVKNKMEKYLCPIITTSAGLSRNVFYTGKTSSIFLWLAIKFHTNFTKIHKRVALPVFYAEASWTHCHQENSNAYINVFFFFLWGRWNPPSALQPFKVSCAIPRFRSPVCLQKYYTSDGVRDLYYRKEELWARNVRSNLV